VPFVRQEMLEGSQEESAELALLGAESLEIVFRSRNRAKNTWTRSSASSLLSLAPHIDVKRIPICPAEFRQRLVGLWRRFATRRHHHGPARRHKVIAPGLLRAGR